MNVQKITMPQEAALLKLNAAERQIKRFRNPDPRLLALRDGYRTLAKGTPMIELCPAIGGGGWDEEGRPRLAVARSDRLKVRFSFSSSWRDGRSSVVFRSDYAATQGNWWNNTPNAGATMRRSIPVNLFGDRTGSKLTDQDAAVALVPMVPPDAMEQAGNPSLKSCFTLFEADWTEVPPVDPMLLKHLGGDLYAVLAHWDLTDLERSVMADSVESD